MSRVYDIMVVEDDENLAYLLSEQLTDNQFNVKVCSTGNQALTRIKEEHVDLFVLDIVLPDMDGISLAKTIKEKDKETPIVFLTSRNLKSDQLLGFEIGADDYITKPFDVDLLVMRLQVILNRCYGTNGNAEHYEMGESKLDPLKKKLKSTEGEFKLSGTECGIIACLMKANGEAVSRDQIMTEVWGKSDFFVSKSLDVYLTKIRKILAQTDLKLETIHGFGYSLTITGE